MKIWDFEIFIKFQKRLSISEGTKNTKVFGNIKNNKCLQTKSKYRLVIKRTPGLGAHSSYV